MLPVRSRNSLSSWSPTRRSSSLTTLISRWRSRDDRLEIPECRQNLRLRQPDIGAGGVYDTFTKRLVETAGAMKVADGFAPGAVIGPLIDMKAVEKVEAHIAGAVKKGAKVVTAGKRRSST